MWIYFWHNVSFGVKMKSQGVFCIPVEKSLYCIHLRNAVKAPGNDVDHNTKLAALAPIVEQSKFPPQERSPAEVKSYTVCDCAIEKAGVTIVASTIEYRETKKSRHICDIHWGSDRYIVYWCSWHGNYTGVTKSWSILW